VSSWASCLTLYVVASSPYHVTIERTTECPTAVVKANTTWREFPALPLRRRGVLAAGL